MIFVLQYALVVAGYAATAFLIGNYMKQYTGANDTDLGFIFMIQPAMIFVRPFVCSLADRYQAHRLLYLYCSMVSVASHIPFILIPFVVHHQLLDERLLTCRVRFWLLVLCHFIGCVCFSCMRTLGDVLTVNHCKRIGSNYTNYRRYGPISFGICSLLLGYINTGHSSSTQSIGIPDYVPGFILYTGCHLVLALLFYLWPAEFFVIYSDSQLDKLAQSGQPDSLPSGRETLSHIKMKAGQLFRCAPSRLACARSASNKLAGAPSGKHEDDWRLVDSRQQIQIMLVLMRRHFRMPLFLLLLVLGGIVGHSVQNFVYVYLNSVCQRDGCNSSTISGYIMAGICISETLAYMLASRMANIPHKLLKIQLALFTLAVHYWMLAYLTTSSPYYFLVEAAHGFEFGLMVATSIECGDLFANKVDLIIPELLRRRIVTARDDLDRIRVSLAATMIACFLLVYDGLGAVIGSLMYGVVVNTYGFSTAFALNASLSAITLFAILSGSCLTSTLKIKPRVSKEDVREPAAAPSNVATTR